MKVSGDINSDLQQLAVLREAASDMRLRQADLSVFGEMKKKRLEKLRNVTP